MDSRGVVPRCSVGAGIQCSGVRTFALVSLLEVSPAVRRRVRIASELPSVHPSQFDEIDMRVDALPDPALLRADERAGALRAAQGLINRLEAYKHHTAAAADAAQDSRVLNAGSTGTLTAIAGNTNLPTGSAVVLRAVALQDLPHVAEAFTAGRISVAHVQILTGSCEQIDGFAAVEATLVGVAQKVEPAELGRLVAVLIERSRPEDLDRDQQDALRRRGLSVSRLTDGMFRIDGMLDPICGLALTDLLAQISGRPSAGDARSPRQRRADALAEIIAVVSATIRPLGVSPVTVTVDIDTLPDGFRARLEDGTPLGPDTAELLTCTPQLAVIFGNGTEGGFVPLHMARTARRATHHQWAALTARDHGCIRCGRAPRYCHAHHITHWAAGGKTDIDNMALLCGRCHTDLHYGHYTIEMTDGRPEIHRKR